MQRSSEAGARGASTVERTELTVEHRGISYRVPVVRPAVAGPHPLLVLDLHSSHGNAASQAACSGLDALVDRHGFVVARPEGVIDADVPNPERLWLWNVPGVPTTTGFYPTADARDDVAFLTDVIDAAAERFGTKPRAAMVGMSGGARMASAYAAARPDRVLALAAVAGLRSTGLDRSTAEVATPRRAVPVLAIHGDADETNHYDGGDEPRWDHSVPTALRMWADHNGCDGPSLETPYAEGVTRVVFGGPDLDREVTLYRVHGGSHSWPGSDDEGAFARLDASALIADFFAARAVD